MRKERNPAAVKIAKDIIAAYKPESVEEMHEAIKDVFGPMFEAIQNWKKQLKIAVTVILIKSSKPRWAKPKFQFRVIVPPNLNLC